MEEDKALETDEKAQEPEAVAEPIKVPEGYVSPDDFSRWQSKMQSRQATLEKQLGDMSQYVQQFAADRQTLQDELFELKNADEDEGTKTTRKRERDLLIAIGQKDAEIARIRDEHQAVAQRASYADRIEAMEVFAKKWSENLAKDGVLIDPKELLTAVQKAKDPLEMHEMAITYLVKRNKGGTAASDKLARAQERVRTGAETFDKGEASGGKSLIQRIKDADDKEFAAMEARALRGERLF